MLNYDNILFNKNKTVYNISEYDIKHERYGYCRYIIDISYSVKNIPNRVISLAMFITNYFFIINSYINFDKKLISVAALLLSCKLENYQGRMQDLVRCFIHKEKKQDNPSYVITQEEVNITNENLSIAEIDILKCTKFETKYEFSRNIIEDTCLILFKSNYESILSLSLKVENDSFYTLANNLYNKQIVALSCIIISFQFLSGINNIENITNIDVNYLINSECFSILKYDINKNDLFSCILLILEYYDDMCISMNNINTSNNIVK